MLGAKGRNQQQKKKEVGTVDKSRERGNNARLQPTRGSVSSANCSFFVGEGSIIGSIVDL
eukprot:3610970-Ditylum_brightwellii.AAC.2